MNALLVVVAAGLAVLDATGYVGLSLTAPANLPVVAAVPAADSPVSSCVNVQKSLAAR